MCQLGWFVPLLLLTASCQCQQRETIQDLQWKIQEELLVLLKVRCPAQWQHRQDWLHGPLWDQAIW